jgi:23S rRNA C2498 (ribose-2'-O)-methylase RlmM
MNKHIVTKHLVVWCRWKIVNLSLAMEEQQQEVYGSL